MTNGDRIRAMSDEELVDIMIGQDELDERIHFCQNLPECEAFLATPDGTIPQHKCRECLLKWLRQETEV